MHGSSARREAKIQGRLSMTTGNLRWWSPGKTPRTTLSIPSHSGGGPPIFRFWPCVACLVAIPATRRRAVAAATVKTMVALFCVDGSSSVRQTKRSCWRAARLAKALRENPTQTADRKDACIFMPEIRMRCLPDWLISSTQFVCATGLVRLNSKTFSRANPLTDSFD